MVPETAGRSGVSRAAGAGPRAGGDGAGPRAGGAGAGPRAGGDGAVRRSSLGLSAGLLVQYALGLWVNLYVTVPARDHGGGEFGAIGRALANGPAALAVHAGLGLLLLVGSVVLVVRAVADRRGFFLATSLVTLLAVLGAAGSGAAFVNAGGNGASLGMGLLTAVALLCQVLNLFRLSSPHPASGQSLARQPGGRRVAPPAPGQLSRR